MSISHVVQGVLPIVPVHGKYNITSQAIDREIKSQKENMIATSKPFYCNGPFVLCLKVWWKDNRVRFYWRNADAFMALLEKKFFESRDHCAGVMMERITGSGYPEGFMFKIIPKQGANLYYATDNQKSKTMREGFKRSITEYKEMLGLKTTE